MTFSLARAAVAAGSLQLVLATTLLAQAPGAAGAGAGAGAGGAAAARPVAPVAARPSGTNVAVIDISLVFENFPGFQKQMAELKSQVEEFEGVLKAENGEMMKLREKMSEYSPGSDNYKSIEESMARKTSDLQIRMAKQRREFLEKEARIYFDGYNEVYNVVSTLADRNDIKLVLRFNSEAMKPDDRNSVLQGVNRAVVFQRNLNITNLVIRELNGGTMPSTIKTPENGTASRTSAPGAPNRK